jgi:O-methyltransferase
MVAGSRWLPVGLRARLASWAAPLRAALDPERRAYLRWVRGDYDRFAQAERARILLSIARFCHINRPLRGYYFEFGCHGANTMRLAWRHSRHLFDWTYVAFDSFEGLPEIGEVDKQEIWQRGKLRTEEEGFVRLVTRAGMPRERLITVKGFYDQSLTPALKERLGSHERKAVVVYVDCDLYQSTVPVLEFAKDFLQKGTIIVFDDWNCFHGDPERGERRAWSEFRARYPKLRFEEFVRTNEAQSFIFVGSSVDAPGPAEP